MLILGFTPSPLRCNVPDEAPAVSPLRSPRPSHTPRTPSVEGPPPGSGPPAPGKLGPRVSVPGVSLALTDEVGGNPCSLCFLPGVWQGPRGSGGHGGFWP